jgi:hypothetical protein
MLLETHVCLQRAGPDKFNSFNPILARVDRQNRSKRRKPTPSDTMSATKR